MSTWLDGIKKEAALQVAGIGQARHALVTGVDPAKHAVRVTIQPDGIESGWIPDASLAAGGIRIMCPSEIGTQVVVVSMEGDAEHPVVIGRLFDVSTMPAVSPVSGEAIGAGEVAVLTSAGGFFHISGTTITIAGTVSVRGSVSVSGDVTASGISLTQHLHSGVQSGKSYTAAPVVANG